MSHATAIKAQISSMTHLGELSNVSWPHDGHHNPFRGLILYRRFLVAQSSTTNTGWQVAHNRQ